jgi:K+-sensing histidine kinase KdpD
MSSDTRKIVPEFVKTWFDTNTFVPPWLPKRLQHSASAYAIAGLIQGVAISLTAGLIYLVPGFTFRGALILLGVIGVALTLGGAPGLLASLVGATLLDLFLVPPVLSIVKKGADLLTIVFYLIVCLAANLSAAHAQQTRRASAP